MAIRHIENGIAPIKSKLVYSQTIDTSTINAMDSKDYTYTPPPGVVWSINSMYISVGGPLGASMGTHEFQFLMSGGALSFLQAEQLFNASLQYDNSCWSSASAYNPSDISAVLAALRTVRFTKEHPLTIRYFNLTDANQTRSRGINIFMLEESIIL